MSCFGIPITRCAASAHRHVSSTRFPPSTSCTLFRTFREGYYYSGSSYLSAVTREKRDLGTDDEGLLGQVRIKYRPIIHVLLCQQCLLYSHIASRQGYPEETSQLINCCVGVLASKSCPAHELPAAQLEPHRRSTRLSRTLHPFLVFNVAYAVLDIGAPGCDSGRGDSNAAGERERDLGRDEGPLLQAPSQ